MADYTPKDWDTGDVFQASDATSMSQELEEQEVHDLTQDQRLTNLERNFAASQSGVESLDDGFCLPHRLTPHSSVSMVSRRVQLEFFTAPKTINCNNIQKITGVTPAAATPTLIRMGVYSVAANGDLTRIAATPSDTTLFGAGFSIATKPFSAPCPFVHGQRYASALLIVSSVALPSIWGVTGSGGGMLGGSILPKLAGQIIDQDDLATNYTAAQVLMQTSAYTFTRFM